MLGQPQRIVILSDLHLGPDSGEPGPAIARFLDRLAALETLPAKLILLGDTFDLARAEDEVSGSLAQRRHRRLARLDAILDRHKALETSLARLVDLGVEVVFVLGNHDLPLADPALQARLRARLGASETSLPVAHRYLLMPGVLYAEHGSQYHDINAVAGRPIDSRGRLRLPLAAYVAAISRLIRPDAAEKPANDGLAIRTTTIARLVAAGVAEMARRPLFGPTSSQADHELRDPSRLDDRGLLDDRGPLDDRGRLEGLDGSDRLAGLDRLDRLAVLPMLGRILRVVATRTGSSCGPQPSVAGIAALLRSAGHRVPILVLAHTHVTSFGEVPGTEGRVTWFNSGSWSEATRGLYPFVAVDPNGRADSSGPAGHIAWWNDQTSAVEEPADHSTAGVRSAIGTPA